MPERTVNPQDNVDLILSLASYGDTLGTLYPRAHVYDTNNSEITGSPFALTKISDNLYVNSGAFQATQIGTYKVVYLIYTDSGYTTRSAEHQEISDVINVKIQSTTGLGGYGSMKNGGDVIVDFDIVQKMIDKFEKKVMKDIKKLQKDFNAGLKVDVPTVKFDDVLKGMSELKIAVNSMNNEDIKSLTRKECGNLMNAIKKNRTTIIKKAFDKKLLKPMLGVAADSNLKITQGFKDLKISVTKTIDMKNEEANKMFNNTLESNNTKIENGLNSLNESIRKKLNFTLQGLKALMFMGRQPKNDINITLKKDE